MKKTTFGVIVGNRGFFPDVLAQQGREDILKALKKNGFKAVTPDATETKYGAVETLAEAKKCAELFARKADEIDGIIVTLPNFGDEKGVMEAIKLSGLKVPVLIQAEPDEPGKMMMGQRRDSFCGKISTCNNLRQAGINFSLTNSHTVSVSSEEFVRDLEDFAATCRIVKGLKNSRFGAIGARPGAFNTVRFSEKLLELTGISVETIDLSEILGQAEALKDDDKIVRDKLVAIKEYAESGSVPQVSMLRLAKFGAVVDRWVAEWELDGTAIQCWTSLQENFGICSCVQMSMMGEYLGKPSACEVDIMGLVGMYLLQLASGTPSALLDWNNNCQDNPDKCVCFHCSNLPRSFFQKATIDFQEIIAGSVGKENTWGTIVGQIKPSPMTFCRLTTNDAAGVIQGYLGQGEFTNDPLETFGGYGVAKIPNLQTLLQFICINGFEHHVAVNLSQKAEAVAEALENYLGWDIYRHI
ncbi:MAG: fucose isomerase [Phycisphaerae bacterium SM23_30]|nr:MAG: fucose isomerase [Phycisphaerae bacterium SM23_30]